MRLFGLFLSLREPVLYIRESYGQQPEFKGVTNSSLAGNMILATVTPHPATRDNGRGISATRKSINILLFFFYQFQSDRRLIRE